MLRSEDVEQVKGGTFEINERRRSCDVQSPPCLCRPGQSIGAVVGKHWLVKDGILASGWVDQG